MTPVQAVFAVLLLLPTIAQVPEQQCTATQAELPPAPGRSSMSVDADFTCSAVEQELRR